MITVQVGKPRIKVYIAASLGFFGSGGVREAFADSNGDAHINFDDFGESFNGEIFVDGLSIYKGRIESDGIY